MSVDDLQKALDKLTVICYAANGDVILMLDPKDMMVFLKDKVWVDRKQLERIAWFCPACEEWHSKDESCATYEVRKSRHYGRLLKSSREKQT